MEEIRKEDFDWCLEIHSDMLFIMQGWLDKLLSHDSPNCGILMPFTLRGYNLKASPKELYGICKSRIEEVVVKNPIQVHPWLLKMEMIKEIGYYDPIFSPMWCEDDDFYYRVVTSNKWFSLAVKSVWAGHYLSYAIQNEAEHSMVRVETILNRNLNIFKNKHALTVKEFKTKYLNDYLPVFVSAEKRRCGIFLLLTRFLKSLKSIYIKFPRDYSIKDFRFISKNDIYDLKWDNWSRTYEYTYILKRLHQIHDQTSVELTLHNTACGGDGQIHKEFSDYLINNFPKFKVCNSDVQNYDKLKYKPLNFHQEDITAPSDIKYDIVLNISTIEHLPPGKIKIALYNLLNQIKPGGFLFLTFDYPDVNLKMIEKYIGGKCMDTPERLSGLNSVIPSKVFTQFNIVYLEINKNSK
jgi:hypothetical protein